MTDVIAFVIALGFGFGLSLWLFSTALEKSNNIGDSIGGKSAYKAFAKFTVRRDRMNGADRDCFSTQFARSFTAKERGPEGEEPVRRLTPEEIARIKGNTADVDIGQLREKRFAMRDTPYEQQGSLDDLHGVFGKVDEE